jgi:hypothetical protein
LQVKPLLEQHLAAAGAPTYTSRLEIQSFSEIRARPEADVIEAIVRLTRLDREELAQRWRKRFGVAPPKGCGRGLLETAAAYDIREKVLV